MSSKIEQQIDQIEDFIDSCRYQTFSKTNIIVDKDELDGMLEELRARTPEEIKHYQRIINNRDAILEDARRKADEMINDATQTAQQMVDESEIVARAEDKASQIVSSAENEAQAILDQANAQAQAISESATTYMDNMLAAVDSDTTRALNELTSTFGSLHSILSDYISKVRSNRAELAPQDEEEYADEEGYENEEPADNGGDFVNTDMM